MRHQSSLEVQFFGFAIERVGGIRPPGRLLWSYRFRALVGCVINPVSKFFGFAIETVGGIRPPGRLLWSYRFRGLVGCVINISMSSRLYEPSTGDGEST